MTVKVWNNRLSIKCFIDTEVKRIMKYKKRLIIFFIFLFVGMIDFELCFFPPDIIFVVALDNFEQSFRVDLIGLTFQTNFRQCAKTNFKCIDKWVLFRVEFRTIGNSLITFISLIGLLLFPFTENCISKEFIDFWMQPFH